MVNKKIWLGMLVMVLVFGMTVVGCEEEVEVDTNPSPPTGLAGTANSPTSVNLTWNSVNNANEYWINYKNNSDATDYGRKEGIKSTSYTITDLVPATTYDFQVAVKNTDGYVSGYSSVISIKTLPPSTGSISLSYLGTSSLYVASLGYSYTISISLKLSKGSIWNSAPQTANAKSWVTVTGLDLSDWNFQAYIDTLDKDLRLSYTSKVLNSAIVMPSGGITVSIDQAKFSEMKGFTNITSTLTAGTPLSRTSLAWTN